MSLEMFQTKIDDFILVLIGEGFNTCFQIYETMIESFLSFKDFIQFTTTFLRDEFVSAN